MTRLVCHGVLSQILLEEPWVPIQGCVSKFNDIVFLCKMNLTTYYFFLDESPNILAAIFLVTDANVLLLLGSPPCALHFSSFSFFTQPHTPWRLSTCVMWSCQLAFLATKATFAISIRATAPRCLLRAFLRIDCSVSSRSPSFSSSPTSFSMLSRLPENSSGSKALERVTTTFLSLSASIDRLTVTST